MDRETNPAGLERITTRLSLHVTQNHFQNAAMTIKCMASLANLYLQSAQVIIREPSNTWLVSSNLYHTSGQCLEFVFFSYVDNSFLPTCVAFVKRSSFVLVLTIAHHKSSYSSPLSSDMPSYSYALLHTYRYIMHMNTSMPCAYNIYISKSRFRPRYFYIFMVVFFVSLMQLCIFGMFFSTIISMSAIRCLSELSP